MSEKTRIRDVRSEFQLRLTCPRESHILADLLEVVRREGGDLKAHLIYELGSQFVALFVCEKASQAAAALQEKGITVETETVVVVRTDNRWGVLSHLVRTLAAEGIKIGYTYASALLPELYVVLRTDDNPKAEDLLRNYLILPDPGAAETTQ